MPLCEVILEQTTFLNIESIKPLNPEENSRRKSAMSVSRKTHDRTNMKVKRKSFDTTVGFDKK